MTNADHHHESEFHSLAWNL